MKKLPYIVFSPFSLIFAHSIPEMLILSQLNLPKNSVQIGCKGVLRRSCAFFESKFKDTILTEERASRICKSCINCQKKIAKKNNLKYVPLEDLVETGSVEEILKLVENADNNELINLKEENLNIGKIAAYETILHYQKNDLSFSGKILDEYKRYLINALIVAKALRKFFDKYKFRVLFVYNRLYSVNNTVATLAEEKGIKLFSMHAGSNLSERLNWITVFNGDQKLHAKFLMKEWQKYNKMPISEDKITLIGKHLKTSLTGQSKFSYNHSKQKSIDIKKRFCIGANKKIIVATLSSEDERFAAASIGKSISKNNRVFSDQSHWIKWLYKFAARNPDIHLIVRVHPRLENKNRKVQSKLVREIIKIRQREQSNISFDFPKDKVSISNYMKNANLLLNHHSSAALEFLTFGIPVLIWSENEQVIPTDLMIVAKTKSDYEKKIHLLIKEKRNLKRTIFVYRWLALKQLWCNICLENKPILSLETNYNYLNPNNLISHFMRNYAPVLFLSLALLPKYELRDKSVVQHFINSDEKTLLNLRKTEFIENLKYKEQIKINVAELMQRLDFNKVEIQRFVKELEDTSY